MEFDLNKRYCYYFNEISKIPRGSRNEKAVSDYVVEIAKQNGLEYRQDGLYNVIVEIPASAGYEDAETVMLQAHLDMVCEKNKDSAHDFEKDPLDLYVDEEGWLHARGTTLGADDGMGVAYMLAMMEDRQFRHPALQLIFTVMEEIGLNGAAGLDPRYLHGRRYINLDGGGEVSTDVTSSGGTRCAISRPLHFEENKNSTYCLEVRGLMGGHSAGKIHLELGNAIIIGARLMERLCDAAGDIRLCDINGGMKFNAIPREADFVFSSNADRELLLKTVNELSADIKNELKDSDPGFRAQLRETDTADKALSVNESRQIIDFLFVIPNGLLNRSMAIPGLSLLSLNAGVIRFADDILHLDDMIRSAISSHGDMLIRKLEILCENYGFSIDSSERYYGWEYEKDSPLREILRDVLKEKGIELKESFTHGGLECGIFKGMIPDLDIITYGPIAENCHTPDEKLDLASFDRAYDTLLKVLERCD